MVIDLQYELLESIEGDVRRLMAQHQKHRRPWNFHDFVPWEEGRNFLDDPWEESHATLPSAARTALVLNLLTEDNLPYYHEAIGTFSPRTSALRAWNQLWTAEEGQHAIAMRSYLLTTRNCDPDELELGRVATMTNGYDAPFETPLEAFAYTSAQELATRVSHRNAGKITDDPVAFKLMKKIATDENHHFVFYRGVVAALIREEPSLAIASIHRVFMNFEMPGVRIPRFRRHALEIAKAGVYNLRVHSDHVIQSLIREWKIDSLVGLTPEAARLQDEIMAHPADLIRRAERFEERVDSDASRSMKRRV